MASKRGGKASKEKKADDPHDISVTMIFDPSISTDDPEHPRAAIILAFRTKVNEILGVTGQQFVISAASFPHGRKANTTHSPYPSTVGEIQRYCQEKLNRLNLQAVSRIINPGVTPSRVIKNNHYLFPTSKQVLGPEQNSFTLQVASVDLWIYDWAFMRIPERKAYFASLTAPFPRTMAQLREMLAEQFHASSSQNLAPTCLYFEEDDSKHIDWFIFACDPSGSIYGSDTYMRPRLPFLNVRIVFGQDTDEHAKGTVLHRCMTMDRAHRFLKLCSQVSNVGEFAFVLTGGILSEPLKELLLGATVGFSHDNNPRTCITITI